MTDALVISPYGDRLVDLIVPSEEADRLRSRALSMPSLQLSDRAACDLELLATGAFLPLDRFVGQKDYERILGEMRLTSGHIFPIPITLPVEPTAALKLDREVADTMIGPGYFVEVFVDTPLEVCEQRDTKGMYAKARRGDLKDFTGIDDPYEPPINPDITINTVKHTAEQNARLIPDHLVGLRSCAGTSPALQQPAR